MKKLLFPFVFILSGIITVSGQNSGEFQPKLLFKDIEKEFFIESPVLEKIEIEQASTSPGSYFLIGNSSLEKKAYVYSGRIFSCRPGGCDLQTGNHTNSGSEYFDYFILFDKNGEVQKVRVYNYQASHGEEVTSSGWLNQFKGYKGDYDFSGRNSIDAIAGATISSKGIIRDIEQRTKELQIFLKGNHPGS